MEEGRFKVIREEYPAIFSVSGVLYREYYSPKKQDFGFTEYKKKEDQ